MESSAKLALGQAIPENDNVCRIEAMYGLVFC